MIVVARNCGVGSPQEYQVPLQLLRSLQGSQPSVVITTAVQELSRYTRDFVDRYRATISEKHAELLRRFSGDSVADSASILSRPEERAYVSAVLQAFKHMNEFLDAYPEAPSDKTREQVMSFAATSVPQEAVRRERRSGGKAILDSVIQKKAFTGDYTPVIAASETAQPVNSLSIPIPSEDCSASMDVERTPPVQGTASVNKQDSSQMEDPISMNGSCSREEDSTASKSPSRRKFSESDNRGRR